MTTLAYIRTKVRRLTKMPSANQLTNEELDTYINTFYLYDLPNTLRLINLKQLYTFKTAPNVDIYDFTPNSYISIEGPVYVGGLEVRLYQNRQTFFEIYPELQRNQTLTQGNGSVGAYSGTITGVPVKTGRVLISTVSATGSSLSAQDDGSGGFTGDVTAGSIDYITGSITNVMWTSSIASGTDIKVQSVNYQAAKPTAILFYNDQFQLFPVPDQTYEIQMNAFIRPTALLDSSDEPLLQEWGDLIAYGSAAKIFADNLDIESYEKNNIFYDKQKSLVERRTLQQLKINRTNTIYSDNYGYRNLYTSGS